MTERRRLYAEHIIACADTVTLLRTDEVDDVYRRAAEGEFDEDESKDAGMKLAGRTE